MVTFLCLLSWCFTVVLLELGEGLEEVVLLGLYEVCVLDLLRSLEWVEELLCEDDLLCVCCGNNNKSLCDGDMKCFCEGIYDINLSGFCASYYDCDFGICKNVMRIWTCYTCAYPWDNV